MAATNDFNEGIILPPLIAQLRKILDQYPDDTQILKVRIIYLVTVISLTKSQRPLWLVCIDLM